MKASMNSYHVWESGMSKQQEINEIKEKGVVFLPVLGISVLPIDCHPLVTGVLQKQMKFIVSILLGSQSQLQNGELNLQNTRICIWTLHVLAYSDKYFQTG